MLVLLLPRTGRPMDVSSQEVAMADIVGVVDTAYVTIMKDRNGHQRLLNHLAFAAYVLELAASGK